MWVCRDEGTSTPPALLLLLQAPTVLADNEGSPFHELGLKEVMDGVRGMNTHAKHKEAQRRTAQGQLHRLPVAQL